jgi:tetratricopeptide (TPR) repeat protein
MRTPHFEELCAEIRGIDLADDARLRAHLEGALPTASPDDAEPWLLLAVLAIRAGEVDDAIAALVNAAMAGAPSGATAFLRAHLLAERGDLDAAKAALDAAEAGEEIAPADLLHARGALAWAAGDRNAGLALFRAGLDDAPNDAARWLDLGRALAHTGASTEAIAAFERAIEEDEELLDARYERASTWATGAAVDEAADELDALAAIDPAFRERARLDPRWRARRGDPVVAAVLSPPVRAPVWIADAPPWLPALARDAEVARLGLEWVDEATSQRLTADVLHAHTEALPGTFGTAATRQAAATIAQRCIVVARGPRLGARDRTSTDVLWLLDREASTLRMAPSHAYPAFLWIPAGRDAASVRAAIAAFVPQPFADLPALDRRVRGFLGYRLRFGVPSPSTGALVSANAAQLDRHFAASPFCEPGAWGSSHTGDPWPEELPAQPQLAVRLAAQEQAFARQRPGRVWSISRRTRHSRSILTIELHHRDVFVAMVRYQPAPHGAVVDAVNQRFGTDYPRDLPIDALAALLGFRFDGADDLGTRLATADAATVAGLLQVMSALRHDDLGVTALYRRFLDHPDLAVRSTLYNICVAHNHEALLEEACTSEPDAEIRAQIEGILDEGIAPVLWDPLSDHELDGDEGAAP